MGVRAVYTPVLADTIKPKLFFHGGTYYSVYGDTQLAGHIPVGDGNLRCAFRYAGNPIYVVTRSFPATLQSAGIDDNGIIWVADRQGNLAFFDTARNEYLSDGLSFSESAECILIPRKNLSSSLFICEKASGRFVEKTLDLLLLQEGGTTQARHLPPNTSHVLYCSGSRLISIAGAEIVVRDRGEVLTKRIELKANENILEAVYDEHRSEVLLLIANNTNPAHYPVETLRSWISSRLIQVSVSDLQ
jgi:hypothetical protein